MLGCVAPASLYVVWIIVTRHILIIIYFTSDMLLFHIYMEKLNSCW